jgi:hypothetical protein
MTPLVGQLPSTSGLESYVSKHEQETKAFQKRKASHFHYVKSAKCPSGTTPYEKNLVAELHGPSSVQSKTSRSAVSLGSPATSPTIKAGDMGFGEANSSKAATARLANPPVAAINACASHTLRSKVQKPHSKPPSCPTRAEKKVTNKPPAEPFAVALKQLAAAAGQTRNEQVQCLMDFMKVHISRNWELTSAEMASFVRVMKSSAPLMQVCHLLMSWWHPQACERFCSFLICT